MADYRQRDRLSGRRARMHEIIFEADTRAGRLFDLALIVAILISVGVVLLDSVASVHERFGPLLLGLEWTFTVLFTIEYVLRLASVGRPLGYATSFFGVVDLLAILPTYLSLFLPGSQYLSVVRVLRVLRIFRVLKFVQYVGESAFILQALRASRRKILVFLFAIFTLVIIIGSILYLVEGEESGFTSIPRSMYWAIVTLTTVGYGDIAPQTSLGQALASLVMVLGYSILAVPTGIVSVEAAKLRLASKSTQACPACSAEGHDDDAKFCKACGARL